MRLAVYLLIALTSVLGAPVELSERNVSLKSW